MQRQHDEELAEQSEQYQAKITEAMAIAAAEVEKTSEMKSEILVLKASDSVKMKELTTLQDALRTVVRLDKEALRVVDAMRVESSKPVVEPLGASQKQRPSVETTMKTENDFQKLSSDAEMLTMNSRAMREFRARMFERVKGRAAMCLEVWRINMKVSLMNELQSLEKATALKILLISSSTLSMMLFLGVGAPSANANAWPN